MYSLIAKYKSQNVLTDIYITKVKQSRYRPGVAQTVPGS